MLRHLLPQICCISCSLSIMSPLLLLFFLLFKNQQTKKVPSSQAAPLRTSDKGFVQDARQQRRVLAGYSCSSVLLRNSDTLGQIARLVDIEAPQDGQVVTEQLQRDNVYDGLQRLHSLRHLGTAAHDTGTGPVLGQSLDVLGRPASDAPRRNSI